MGAGVLEALQRRYNLRSYFDAELHGYVSTVKASLDKSGAAGMQRISILQPLADDDWDVANAIKQAMKRPGMDKAQVLFVASDNNLPFGQLRVRTAYNSNDQRIQSAYAALGAENKITCLHVGAGMASSSEDFSEAEAEALPRTLGNGATAVEVFLSEADLGLVMRYINRPEVYEQPSAASKARGDAGLRSLSEDDQFVLFDLMRDRPTDLPENVQPLETLEDAYAALGERPSDRSGVTVNGRRFANLEALQRDMVQVLMNHEPGQHLRFQDDEDMVKAMMAFHPAGDRLLDDLVAVKVDCSPIDDNVRCFWAIKFDGEEYDFSLKQCLQGLQSWMELEPAPEARGLAEADPEAPRGFQESKRKALEGPKVKPGYRLGAGNRWYEGIRQNTFQRAKREEFVSLRANE